MLGFDRLYVPFFNCANPPVSQDLPYALPSQAITLGHVIHRPAAYEVQEHKFLLKVWPGLFPEDRNLGWEANQILLHRLPHNFVLQIQVDDIQTFNPSTRKYGIGMMRKA